MWSHYWDRIGIWMEQHFGPLAPDEEMAETLDRHQLRPLESREGMR